MSVTFGQVQSDDITKTLILITQIRPMLRDNISKQHLLLIPW
jgi:hypothetical protein